MKSKITVALAFLIASVISGPAFAGMNGVDYLNYLKLPRASQSTPQTQNSERREARRSVSVPEVRSGKKAP